MFWVAALGLCGPLFAVGIFVSGGGYRKFSEDFSAGFEVQCIYVGSILGCIAVLYFLLPWLRTPYRQWSRALFAAAIAVAVTTVILLGVIYTSSSEIYPRWPMVVPVWLALALSVGALVTEFRSYSKTKPPAVDVDGLSTEDLEVLRKSRREGLKSLRSRGVIPYVGFRDLDESPL
jgi:hypothetical protein